MTHGSLNKSLKENLGIKDNFVRASVGIEDIDDLINLNYAFNVAGALVDKNYAIKTCFCRN